MAISGIARTMYVRGGLACMSAVVAVSLAGPHPSLEEEGYGAIPVRALFCWNAIIAVRAYVMW